MSSHVKQSLGGYSFDFYTRAEAQEDLKAALGHHFSQVTREALRGVKAIKLPVLTAQASGTTLVVPGNGSIQSGPQQGYFWRIGRITVSSSGTDTGAVSLYAGSDPNALNQEFLVDNTLAVGKAYYPGNRGLFLWPGEQLYASITSVAGNTYRIAGIAVEVPAEMAGKILV